jgi:hypothetical protein
VEPEAPLSAGKRETLSDMASRRYRLIVEGELDNHVQLAFEGLVMTRKEGNTVLVGPVRDQAELQGILQRVSDLGLTLLGATVVREGDEA